MVVARYASHPRLDRRSSVVGPPCSGEQASKTLVIFAAPLDADQFALRYSDGHDDRPATNAAILHIRLISCRTIHDHLDLLPAIGTLNERGFKALHGLPSKQLGSGPGSLALDLERAAPPNPTAFHACNSERRQIHSSSEWARLPMNCYRDSVMTPAACVNFSVDNKSFPSKPS